MKILFLKLNSYVRLNSISYMREIERGFQNKRENVSNNRKYGHGSTDLYLFVARYRSGSTISKRYVMPVQGRIWHTIF